MSNVTFDIEHAPVYGQENPNIYRAAFNLTPDDFEPGLTVPDVSILARTAVHEMIPHYDKETTTLEDALGAKEGNCVSRACLFLTLVAPFQHISKGITLVRYENVGSHWANTVSATDDCHDEVVDSYTIKPTDSDSGRAEVFLRSINNATSSPESYFGGVRNTLQLLDERREDRDFTTNQAILLMEDHAVTGVNLDSVSEGHFTRLSEQLSRGERINPRVVEGLYFNEMAVAVVDVIQGDETVLADNDLAKELGRILSDGVLRQFDRSIKTELVDV